MNTPVSFELAKLLKEKGFNHVYLNSNFYTEGYNKSIPLNLFITKEDYISDKKQYKMHFLAPTIAEVVMWLYEKHDIDVSVYSKLPYIVFPDSEYGEGELQWHFEYRIIKNKDGQKCEVIEPKTWFDERTEAYEEAIKYTVNNLI